MNHITFFKKIYVYKTLLVTGVIFCLGITLVYAERVTGNGYSVEQILAPIQGAISGNGYTVQQAGELLGGVNQGNGYSFFGSFGTSSQVVTPPVTPPSSGGGSNGGGFYVLPPSVTGQIVATSSPNQSSSTSPSSPIINNETILTENGSTCSTRITFSSPIDVGVDTNKVEDVKKLEIFLNTYEGERLTVNGIYENRDIEAVKRWQWKYKSFILDPMRLKTPTGTIYTLSMRQIERQTTKACGEAVVVTSCPFFTTNVSYGDRGDAVKKVQQFLNVVQGETLPLTGVFGPLTKNAVKRFQKSKRVYVATFIPISFATGNWYTTTRIKANETIGCDILR